MKRTKEQIQILDIPIPDTTEQERKVLADAIDFPEVLGDIVPVVHRDFFSTPERAEIWDAIVTSYNTGGTIGYGMAMQYPSMLNEVIPYAGAGMVSEAPYNAILLRDAAARRRAYFASVAFLQEVINPKSGEQDLISATESFARSIEGPSPLQGERVLASVLAEVKEDMDKTAEAVKRGETLRITTGFRYMDEVLNGGYKPGQLVIIAARPSVGKTALMLQMAKSAAQAGNPVQVFSLEMQAAELAERMLYSTGLIKPYEANHGLVKEDTYNQAEAQLKGLPFYINDFSRSLDEIVTRMTQAVKKGRCKIAFIDYLGLISDALNFGNAKLYQVIARVTGTLKAVAKRLEIPIVLLCQLNRDAAREGRPPQLFDLRDSGSIEQDADIVLMLESKMASEGRLYVWLRKHRAGKKEYGFVLAPNSTYSTFYEQAPVLPPEGTKTVTPPSVEDMPVDDSPF